MRNLNKSEMLSVDGRRKFGDSGNSFPMGKVTVHFRDLVERLIEYIECADAILGCVAWLTHVKILEALARVPCGVSIIVQKEEWLRRKQSNLRKSYKEIPTLLSRVDTNAKFNPLGPLVGYLSPNGETNYPQVYSPNPSMEELLSIQPIRCAGVCGNGNFTQPRMHHKFLLFLRKSKPTDERFETIGGDPSNSFFVDAIWNGSFNLTQNATMSLENAIFIETPRGADDFFFAHSFVNEWSQILAISEPLDWTNREVSPEWTLAPRHGEPFHLCREKA
jgi:hypothetical protein